MEQNKTGKYLKYAIGEILLVMIGILLALQVSIWNQARKSRVQEIKIYKELLSDLQLTHEEVNRDMNAHKECLKSTNKLLDHLISKKAYNDSVLPFLFDAASDLQVYPKTSGFEALNSIGLNLLSNDSVRIQITNLYQLHLNRVINEGWRETPLRNLSQYIDPSIDKHVIFDLERGPTRVLNYQIDSITMYHPKIRDYNAFINDYELAGALNLNLLYRVRKINRHLSTSRRIKETIKTIEDELKRIE